MLRTMDPHGLIRVARSALVAAALALLAASPAAAQEPVVPNHTPEMQAQIRRIKQREAQINMQGMRQRILEWRKWTREVRRARELGYAIPRPPAREEEGGIEDGPAPTRPGVRAKEFTPEARVAPDVFVPGLQQKLDAQRLAALQAAGIPTNVRANDPTGDGAGAGQAEQSVAAWGPYVLVAWNDGNGFITNSDTQGYGYSTDGGATFTDGGVPPKLAGWTWQSDPVVTVNEKTGEFWYCGLMTPSASTNGLAVVRGTFTPSGISWDTPVLVRSANNANTFLDKEWMVADSSTGNLYITNTTFTITGDKIDFYRSTDGGLTWSSATTLSSSADNGYVQGSRPAVGPSGELYVTWAAIGQGTVDDYFRIRKSTDGGASFGSEATAAAYISNFGTGAPGFNRPSGITFPSIAVDRTTGPNRGRVYITWNECYNHYETFSTLNGVSEVEPDDTPASATPFTIGQPLRGAFSSTSDIDWFKTTMNAGDHVVVYLDSLPSNLEYSLRIYAPDAAQQLAFGGSVYSAGGITYYTYTATVTGTYYLRMYPLVTGGYRILTTPGIVDDPTRGRDSRDVFLTTSDDGSTWSTPVLVNDTPPLYHEWLPEVSVGSDGCPYVTWFDWRDDVYGSRTHQHISRSLDGGATWQPSQQFTSAQSNFTTATCNIAPNQGDYSFLYSDGRYLHPAWADGRSGNVNVYVTKIDTWHDIAACSSDTTVDAGGMVDLHYTLENLNDLFANDLSYSLSDQRGWSLPAGGVLPVGAASTEFLPLTVAVPDTAAGGVNTLCLTVTNAKGTRSVQCCVNVTVNATTGVGWGPLAFSLEQNIPNPAHGLARIGYTLPRASAVRLRIYGLQGELVRTLLTGEATAGSHTVIWDGRDNSGRRVPAGTYFYRLEAMGRTAIRRMVWMN